MFPLINEGDEHFVLAGDGRVAVDAVRVVQGDGHPAQRQVGCRRREDKVGLSPSLA